MICAWVVAVFCCSRRGKIIAISPPQCEGHYNLVDNTGDLGVTFRNPQNTYETKVIIELLR